MDIILLTAEKFTNIVPPLCLFFEKNTAIAQVMYSVVEGTQKLCNFRICTTIQYTSILIEALKKRIILTPIGMSNFRYKNTREIISFAAGMLEFERWKIARGALAQLSFFSKGKKPVPGFRSVCLQSVSFSSKPNRSRPNQEEAAYGRIATERALVK